MNTQSAKKLGLITCTVIVAGNMMGSGVAMLPSSLAAIGSVTIYSWLLAIIGALGLAFVFAKLGLDDPQEGGPVAYATQVAPILGFQAQTLYFHANWIGNLAIAITSVSYFAPLFPALKSPMLSGVFVIAEIWIMTVCNLMGAKWIGRIASIGFIFVLIPIIATATWGWSAFSSHTFMANWNVTHDGSGKALMSGVLLCIWSFVGVESASVNSALVDNPRFTIPWSTMLGVLIAAIFYVASTTVINGMFPATEIANSSAPFSMAISKLSDPRLGIIVGALMALACFASLGSWIMLVAQAGARASHEGNLPKMFGKLNKNGMPASGVIWTSIFMTVLMLVLMMFHGSTQNIFNEIISIAVLLTVLPYYYSALHLIQLTKHGKRGYLQLAIAVIGILFCFAAFFGATLGAMVGTMIVSIGILAFYVNNHRTIDEQTPQ